MLGLSHACYILLALLLCTRSEENRIQHGTCLFDVLRMGISACDGMLQAG